MRYMSRQIKEYASSGLKNCVLILLVASCEVNRATPKCTCPALILNSLV